MAKGIVAMQIERIKKILKSRFSKPIAILAGSALLTTILMNFEFSLLEAKFYNFHIARGNSPKPDPNIVLIAIDDKTINSLGDSAPLALDFHTRFIETLEKFNPKAIGYLVNMNYVSQINPELFNTEWGPRFVHAASRLSSRGIPVILGTPFDVNGEIIPPYPLSALRHAIAIIHKDGNVFAEDKITRRSLINLYEKPVFHTLLAQKEEMPPPKGSFFIKETGGEYFFFRFHGDPSNSYKTFSFIDIMNENIPLSELNGKTILAGTINQKNPDDFTKTPFTANPLGSPKLSVHADILDSLIHGDSIITPPMWINYLLTFAVSLLVLWWVFGLTPLYGLLASIGLGSIFFLSAHLLFSFHGIWIDGSHPLMGIFLSYYLAVPYRLTREHRKRWDYQKKNEILRQVETLKTNFLSLVTHDLKTPVARIQGLAETILIQSTEHLSDKDKTTLNLVIESTEELNRFISSILELSKIESDRLKPHIESRDINQLIERSIEGFRTHARIKGIAINSNLEPLFPIKMDPSLISKVLNNLIDNAIKYSPQNSSVLIESKEIAGDMVEISVTDSGIGLSSEECQNLFTRFYRVKNQSAGNVPGSGLGLYLTKYFINAHHGQILVESEKGRGSTFRIRLPMEFTVSDTTRQGNRPGLRTILPVLKSFEKIGNNKENRNV